MKHKYLMKYAITIKIIINNDIIMTLVGIFQIKLIWLSRATEKLGHNAGRVQFYEYGTSIINVHKNMTPNHDTIKRATS